MDENVSKAPKLRYYVERQGFFCQAAVILMLLSAVFRLIGCWGLWGDGFFAATQIVLPLACNLLFLLCLLLLGRRLFSATVLPVLLGVVFFIIKSFSFDSWLHTVLCILLYLLVAVLYTATVFGVLRTKWLLVPLFALPFVYHIFVEDMPALSAGEMTFASGMQEMSVLCVMLSLLCTAFAMKKRPPEEVKQPKKPKGGLNAYLNKRPAAPDAGLFGGKKEAPEEEKPAGSAPAEETVPAPAEGEKGRPEEVESGPAD